MKCELNILENVSGMLSHLLQSINTFPANLKQTFMNWLSALQNQKNRFACRWHGCTSPAWGN